MQRGLKAFRKEVLKFLIIYLLLATPIYIWGAYASRTNDRTGNQGDIPGLVSPIPTEAPIVEDNEMGDREMGEKIKTFLENHQSPLSAYSDTFVRVADNYNLDPTLLVALTGCESGFGKNSCGFNPFGWDNCRSGFDSYISAISVVGKALAESPHYKVWREDKENIHQLALTYKSVPPYEGWEACIKGFMEEIND